MSPATARSRTRVAAALRATPHRQRPRCADRSDLRDRGPQPGRGAARAAALLPRRRCRRPDEDEYYHADLIGLEAVLADGTPIGSVRAVHDFGAGDTLEIDRPGGPPAMVPFTRAMVPVVDLDGGRLVVDPPPGLLDEPEAAQPILSQIIPRAGEGRDGARRTPEWLSKGVDKPGAFDDLARDGADDLPGDAAGSARLFARRQGARGRHLAARNGGHPRFRAR